MGALLTAGLIPAIVLIVYVYKLDSIEKEPVSLLIKLFFFGALSCFPAMLLESIGEMVLSVFSADPYGWAYQLVMNVLIVGLSEEFVKKFALTKGSYRHPAFNYCFDGVVYSVVTALGFAGLENVLYISSFGFGVAPIRAITAIPMHAICGVFMGFYYGQMKFADVIGDRERKAQYSRLALWVPVVLHGIYDFAASMDSGLMSLLWLVFVVLLDIYAIRALKTMSRRDTRIW